MSDWQEATLDGVTLAYREVGSGEPVVLIHAGVVADWFAPLLDAPALDESVSRAQLSPRELRPKLARYGTGLGAGARVALRGVAAVPCGRARARRRPLGGAAIALQLALDRPDLVHTLAVLDPALSTPSDGPRPTPPFIQQALAQHAAGANADAVDTFMSGVCGVDYRATLETVLPGAFAQAVADADGLFEQELPALAAWTIGPDDLGRIEQPVLVVVGGTSPPVFAARQRLLLEWLPRAEAFTLPDAGHLLQVEQPDALAEALAAFLGRHAM